MQSKELSFIKGEPIIENTMAAVGNVLAKMPMYWEPFDDTITFKKFHPIFDSFVTVIFDKNFRDGQSWWCVCRL